MWFSGTDFLQVFISWPRKSKWAQHGIGHAVVLPYSRNSLKTKQKTQEEKGWEEPCGSSPDAYHIGHQMTSLDPAVADGIPTISCLHRPPWNPSKLTPHWFINQTAESRRDVYSQCMKKKQLHFAVSCPSYQCVMWCPHLSEAHLRSVLPISNTELASTTLSVMANISQNHTFLKRAAVNTQVGKKFCTITLGSTIKRNFFSVTKQNIHKNAYTYISALEKNTETYN